jgi:hypothetical protein
VVARAFPEDILSHYEQLRACALGTPQPAGLGWALFVHRGMLAWCDAWQELVRPPPDSPRSGKGGSAPSALNPEVVQILATMVLALTQEGGYGH